MGIEFVNGLFAEIGAGVSGDSGFSVVSFLMLVVFVALMVLGWRGFGKCPECGRLFGYWKTGVVKKDLGAGVHWGELKCKRCGYADWKKVGGGGGGISDGGFIFGGDFGDGCDGDCGGGCDGGDGGGG